VAFRLAATAEAVDVEARTRLQAAVDDASVMFESQTPLRLVPGVIEQIVAVDPAKDAYYLAPPGLSSLDPVDPAPTRWTLKSFAAPGSAMLQVDPGQGLEPGVVVEVGGSAQFRIVAAKGDLVTIEPSLPAGDGFAEGTVVNKVTTFVPFGGTARNWQSHVVYLGDKELLNVETAAYIDIVGGDVLGTGATWEYWGKNPDIDRDKVAWWALPPDLSLTPPSGVVATRKPAGSMEIAKVGGIESRWIRARVSQVEGRCVPVTLDALSLRINDRSSSAVAAAGKPPVEVFVNSTPSPEKDFFPLGSAPRMFDTLYVGCAEAFSKPHAQVQVNFDLADTSFQTMAVVAAGPTNATLAGVDKSGSLHLFQINIGGSVSPLFGRSALQPHTINGQTVKLTQGKFGPAAWLSGGDFYVAVAAQSDAWVWHERGGDFVHSGFESLGTAPAGSGGGDIAGLAVMSDGGDAAIVALRGKRLWKRSVQANAAWVALPAQDSASDLDIVSLTTIRSEISTALVNGVVVVAPDPGGVAGNRVYQVKVAGATALLDDVADDVVPAASQSATALRVAAASDDHQNLLAHDEPPSGAVVDTPLSDVIVLPTSLDSHIESNVLTVYGLGASSSGAPVVFAWTPFEATTSGIVFSTDADASTGLPSGSVTLANNLVFVPGTLGQVLALSSSGQRFAGSILANKSLRALATQPVSPPFVAGDVVACAINSAGTQFRFGVIEAGPTVHALEHYYWIRPEDVPADADTKPCYVARGSSKRTGGGRDSNTEYHLDLADTTDTTNDSVLVIETDTNVFRFYRVDTVNSATPRVATLDLPAGETLPMSTKGNYWLTEEIDGRIVPALEFDGSNNGWNADVLATGALYFPSLDPQRQRATAVTRDVTPPGNHPRFVALTQRWSIGPSTGSTPFIVQQSVSTWSSLIGDTTSNPKLSWEYWNGTSWATLPFNGGADTTQNLKNSGFVSFDAPTDFKPTNWSGKTDYWIRARLIGGDYGHEKVVVTAVTSGNTTTQTVDRVVDGIQAPQALEVWVAYQLALDTRPAYLITEDSGTRRDQSDANRSPEARIELFTPLCATLDELYRGQGDAVGGTSPECKPDCDCAGMPTSMTQSRPGTSGAQPQCGADASQAAAGAPLTGRALLLGFSKPPSGEPVNVLLVVERENKFGSAAPLSVEGLIAGRLQRIVASDDTRAIGETGLVSMSFPVPPSIAELFGRSLAWVVLTPSQDPSASWIPMIRGVYLNGVWTHAAETMTFELVGTSTGGPGLELQLARPPVLQGTLELRVHELLGEEERADLLASDSTMVRSDVDNLPGDWVRWRAVADPGDYGPLERVYALDEATGTLIFGDGRHGMIPPPVPDGVVAFTYQRTEAAAAKPAGSPAQTATAAFVPGNRVAPRASLNLVSPVQGVEAVFAADQAAGGAAPDNVERVLSVAPARLRDRGRALTLRDFEDVALDSSSDIAQARAFRTAAGVRVVAVMRGVEPRPTLALGRALRSALEAAALPAFASPSALVVDPPVIRRIRIEVVAAVPSLDVAGDVARYVKQTLRAFFDTATGGIDRRGWRLGAQPDKSDIALALLDAPSVEGLEQIFFMELGDDGDAAPWQRPVRSTEIVVLPSDGVRIDFHVLDTVS
jgi:hypothetical protein